MLVRSASSLVNILPFGVVPVGIGTTVHTKCYQRLYKQYRTRHLQLQLPPPPPASPPPAPAAPAPAPAAAQVFTVPTSFMERTVQMERDRMERDRVSARAHTLNRARVHSCSVFSMRE